MNTIPEFCYYKWKFYCANITLSQYGKVILFLDASKPEECFSETGVVPKTLLHSFVHRFIIVFWIKKHLSSYCNEHINAIQIRVKPKSVNK